MRRIKLSWRNRGVALIWPDHPLVMAGDQVLDVIVSFLEDRKSVSFIADYLSQQFKVSIKEAEEYVINIQSTLEQAELIAKERKGLGQDSSLTQGRDSLAMATVNITKKCDLNCLHCYNGDEKYQTPKEMSAVELEKVVDDLGRLIVRDPRLIIFSGGEPTLEKEKLIVAINVASGYDLNIRLNTNGYGVDANLAEYLASKKVLVQVSLDGPNVQVNSLLRGRDSAFSNALLAIRNLVEANCRTRISCTVHSGNVKEIPAMLDLAEDLGVEQFTTSSLVPIGSALRNNLRAVEYREEFDVLYKAVRSDPKRQRMTKSTLLAETINAIRAGVRFTYCGTGFCTCCVDSDASLYPCINMVRSEYRVGNVASEQFSELWEKSQKLEELRRLDVDTINHKCAICDFRYFCGAYCRGETLAAGKTINSPYARCASWKRGIIKIMSILSESPDIYYFGEDPYKGVMHRE